MPHGHDDDGRDGLRQLAAPLLDKFKSAESAGADIVRGLNLGMILRPVL